MINNKTTSVPNKVFYEHFKKHGYTITGSYAPESIKAVEKLALLMAENYEVTREFIKRLVTTFSYSNQNGHTRFYYRLGGTKKENAVIRNLATMLHEYGILTECDTATETIKGTITPLTRVRQFITGQWLEIYASCVIRDTVKEYAEEKGLPYQILSNVILCKGNKISHEVDCCFSIGNTVYATEQKSGERFEDYLHLHEIGKDLGIVPDHYLLLNSYLIDEDRIAGLEYIYQFYICNTSTVKAKLLEMISQ